MHLLVFPFQMQTDKGLLRFTKVCGSPFMPLTPPKNCIGLNGVDLAASVFFNLHIVSITAELFLAQCALHKSMVVEILFCTDLELTTGLSLKDIVNNMFP